MIKIWIVLKLNQSPEQYVGSIVCLEIPIFKSEGKDQRMSHTKIQNCRVKIVVKYPKNSANQYS